MKQKTFSPLGLSLLMAAVLSACGGGGSDGSTTVVGGGSSSGGGGGSGGGAGSGTSFPFTRYDIYALYGTATAGNGAVTSVSATKGAVVINSFSYRSALAGGEIDVTLGSGSVTLTNVIMPAADLSWLAPGADGQLIQQCSTVRTDAGGSAISGYSKSMLVMVANTATALSQIASIPGGTRLYVAEDCKFTGSNPTGDIAAVAPQANNHVVANADGSLTVVPVGAASFTVSAANASAALATGGTGIDMAANAATGDTVPSTSGSGNYAMHAYSIPRAGSTPRYVVVVQATPAGGNVPVGSKGIVQMWVSP